MSLFQQFNRHVTKTPRWINRWRKKRALMTKKERRHQNIFITVMVVLCLFSISSLFKIARERQQLKALETEQVSLAKQNEHLTTQISGLKKNVAQLKDDSYVEKLAREQYFLSKDGEQIYVIQSGSSAAKPTQSSTKGTQTTQSSTATTATTTTSGAIKEEQ